MVKPTYAKAVAGQGTETSAGCNYEDVGDSNSASSPTITPDNLNGPFYLHSFDNPGLIRITHQLSVGSENYHSWSRSMTMALDAKNKTSLGDSTIT